MMFGIENFIVFVTTGTSWCLFLALFAYLGFSLATARLTVHSGH